MDDSPFIIMTKSAFFLPVIIISLAFMMSGAGAQGMKIGIVDMNRVFAEYYKTKDADKVVNEQKEAAKKELETINNDYKKLLDSYQKLATEIKDPAIGEELRKKKQKEAQEVASKARALEREKKELSDRRQRMLLTEETEGLFLLVAGVFFALPAVLTASLGLAVSAALGRAW